MSQRKPTEKQKRFADEYLIDLNATQAAIRAGYRKKNADKIGSELLGKTGVSEYIQAKQKRLQVKTEITQEKVLAELAKVGFAPSTDFAPNGIPIVESAEHKTTSKVKALELLGRHLGIFDKQTGRELEDLAPLAELIKHDTDETDDSLEAVQPET